MTEDKLAAYQTLYTCLETVASLSAPFAPFISERIFRDLNAVGAGGWGGLAPRARAVARPGGGGGRGGGGCARFRRWCWPCAAR